MQISTTEKHAEKIIKIINQITEGKSLKQAASEAGLSLQRFHELISGHREWAVAYARAQELKADNLVEEAIEIADNPDIDAHRARNMVSIRQWAASKYNSKKFGDRIDLNVSQTLDISATLMEARTRMLRSVSDQLAIEDAQVIDIEAVDDDSAADNKSNSDAEPDIFS